MRAGLGRVVWGRRERMSGSLSGPAACRVERRIQAGHLGRTSVAPRVPGLVLLVGAVLLALGAPRSVWAQPENDAPPTQDRGPARDPAPDPAPDPDPTPAPDPDPAPDQAPDPAPDQAPIPDPAPEEHADVAPGDGEPVSEEDSEGDLFPEEGDLSQLVQSEEDLAIPEVIVRGVAEREAEERETGGAVQRLDEELLERFDYDNPDAVLQQVPGAYVRQEDGYGLRPNIGLRGVSSERSSRITLLEDGVLFGPAPYAAPAAYYFPLMTRMVGVDAFMGAATIPYGPMTVGGALNLRSRDIPREPSGGLDLALGTTWYGRLHSHFGASNEWGGILAEGVYLRSDGFKHLQNQPGGTSQTGFDRGELLLRGEVRGALSDDVYQRLELRVGLAAEASNETYLGLTDQDFREDPWLRYTASQLDRMEWWRTQVQLRHTLEMGDEFELRTIAYRHDLDRSWNKVNGVGGIAGQRATSLFDVLNNPRGSNEVLVRILRGEEDGGLSHLDDDFVLIGTNARRFGVTGIQSDGAGQVETGPLTHRVRAGVRLHHDAVERHHTEDAYSMIDGQLLRATEESYITADTWAEALAFSAYAAYSLTLWDAVTLTPGVRTELIWTRFEDRLTDGASAAFRAAVLPGGSIEWRAMDELTLFAGVMRGFAPVAPGQAANVQPEDSVNYEVGLRLTHPESRTGGQLSAFVNDYSNFLQQCSFSAGCANEDVDTMANAGSVLVAGLDARLSSDIRVGDVTIPLRGAYTFTWTELQEAIRSSPNPAFANGQPGDRLPYIPMHQVSAQAGLELRDFGVNVSGSFVSEMWEAVGRGDDATVPRTDPYFLLDAIAYLRIFDHMRLYVRGENLTYTRAIVSRHPFGARPTRPFQLQVGVRVDI